MKIALALLLALTLSACVSPVQKKAVADVEASGELILPEYLKYVDADAALSPASKDDRKKLVEEYRKLVKKLKESTE